MKNKSKIIVLAVLFILVGCGGANVSSQFPLPESVINFTEQGSADSVNFQTDLTLDEVTKFYETAISEQGLTIKELLTVREEGVSSTVFEGHDSGKSIVVQITDLPTEQRNVNIRLEDM